MNKPSSKQTLIINYSTIPCSFYPHLVSDIRTQTICKALYEGLTRINPQGEVELAVAEKIEVSPCKRRYTFTLRDCIWSNDKAVTSYDFANAWKLAISPQSKCNYTKRFFLIKNAKKAYKQELPLEEIGIYTPSDNRLVIELEHPAPYFLELIADPIYSPIYHAKLDEEPTIFNGPFIIKSYEINKKLTLASNPLYWDAKTVKLKKIEIHFIKDMQTAFSMYEKGHLDYIGSPFINLPDEVIQLLPNVKFKQASAPFWVFFNIQNPKLKSANIRKALGFSIDRKEIIKYIIPKQKEALYSILPKKNFFSPF